MQYMRAMLSCLWLAVACLACSTSNNQPDSIQTTMNAPLPAAYRVPHDERRDELRHPELFLDFAKIDSGSHVLELGAGDGYTTLHIAQRVGSQGAVLALNPPQWRNFMAPYLATRFANGRPPGIEWIERPFDDPIPVGVDDLDVVVNVLTYHDLLYMPVDRAAMNQRLFAALRPGGHYLVIDHSARPEESLAVAMTLHRISKQTVIDEVTAAGFHVVDESPMLAMPEDTRTSLAWTNPQPRTDRFMLLFEVPNS